MRRFRVTYHTTGHDGYPTYEDKTYTEEEILNGVCVYKYDSIVEIKQLDENDPVYIAFKTSVTANELQRQKTLELRLLREKQKEDSYIKAEYEKRFK